MSFLSSDLSSQLSKVCSWIFAPKQMFMSFDRLNYSFSHSTTNKLLAFSIFNSLQDKPFACGNSRKGYIYFDTASNSFKGCNGTEWRVLG